MNKRILGLSFAGLIALACAGCPSNGTVVPPANVIPAVFTVEQTLCMVDGLLSGLLTGTAQAVAADIQTACGLAPALTQDIINFVQAFQNLTDAQKGTWKTWATANRK
jgi:hypothetical protein